MQKKVRRARMLTAAAIVLATAALVCILIGMRLMAQQTRQDFGGAHYVMQNAGKMHDAA